MGAGSSSLTAAIKAEARRLGFTLVGITHPTPTPHGEVFERWLAAGKHGAMAYLATERARQLRADPTQVLPGCRAVIALAIPYHPGLQPAPLTHQDLTRGRVAAYAWGADYHEVLPPRLEALAGFISDQGGAALRWRGYTDTGPVLERDLAQQAGLGWIGKNTCLINPLSGSYFLLAELFVDMAMDPDPPFLADRCGTCTRCIQACPTGCILPDRTIDARRCLSYLTIELKSAIPLELRPLMGSWVFGCDVCQAVCPWNQRFAASLPEPDFAPRPGVPAPVLTEELALSPETFNRKFRGSPIQRPRRRGYLRNVAIALGNRADPAAVPALTTALFGEPEPLVRGAAAWALGRIGDPDGKEPLLKARSTEPDGAVLGEINSAINDRNAD